MKKLLVQILRFGLVGFFCFFIDYGILVFLTEIIGLYYLISSGLSFVVSVIVNYILSFLYVFETGTDNKWKKFLAFVLLSTVGLGINQLIMWFCGDILNIYYMISKVVATAIVMIYNFITRKLILERAVADSV